MKLMGDVIALPLVRFAENKLIEVTKIFEALSQTPFADLIQIKLLAGNEELLPIDAIRNIGIGFSNMADQLEPAPRTSAGHYRWK